MKIRLRPAAQSDRPGVDSLLRSAALPLDGLDIAWGHAFLAEDDRGQLLGVAAIEPHGTEGLLRSVAVHPDARGRHVGQSLVTHVLEQAQQLGFRRLFLLTTTAADWFERWGFRRCVREDVPEVLLNSAEFSGACPDSATVMVRVETEATE